MKYALRRRKMLQDLVEAASIADPRVLEAMGEVPRHLFVEEAFHPHAYADRALPIGEGQTISRPWTVAYMSSLLAVDRKDRVLELGTGSGYQAAVLSRLCAHVYTIERVKPLYELARANLRACRVVNVSLRWGDGKEGWPERAPFDRIIVTAASPDPPLYLVAQLVDGGRLVSPVTTAQGQRLKLITRLVGGRSETRDCGPCEFVPLLPRKK